MSGLPEMVFQAALSLIKIPKGSSGPAVNRLGPISRLGGNARQSPPRSSAGPANSGTNRIPGVRSIKSKRIFGLCTLRKNLQPMGLRRLRRPRTGPVNLAKAPHSGAWAMSRIIDEANVERRGARPVAFRPAIAAASKLDRLRRAPPGRSQETWSTARY
jgi:hypothetical protein